MKYALLAFLMTPLLSAQELTLEQIMADPIWLGKLPSAVRITDDTNMIYFRVPRAIPEGPEWMKLDPKGGEAGPVTDADRPYYSAATGAPIGAHLLYTIGGDIWIARAEGEGYAKRVPLIARSAFLGLQRVLDDTRFLYTEGNNVHLFNLTDGSSVQLTDIKNTSEEKDKELDFISSEEKDLVRYVANMHTRDANNKKDREARRNMGVHTLPAPTYMGKGSRINGSPQLDDSFRWAAVVQGVDDGDTRTEYARWITKDARVTSAKARPKVKHKTKSEKAAILDRDSNTLTWIDLSELPEIKTNRYAEIMAEQSEADKAFAPKIDEEKNRPVSLYSGGFGVDGKLLMTAYSRDWKDKWIFTVNPDDAAVELVDHHHDPAWVQIFMNGAGTTGRSGAAWWAEDRKTIMWYSDQSGYQHVYKHPLGGETSAVTSGDFEVYDFFEGRDGKYVYFHANKEHPGIRHFYRMPAAGGKWEQLTKGDGRHQVYFSPSGTMVNSFSTGNTPPVLRVKNSKGRWRTAYDGTSKQFKDFKFVKGAYVTYTNRDGKEVHARLYKPKKPNGAGVVFVHGAGYLQNAHQGWSGYFREYMFHNLLMREGYTVLDPDFQASSGYGRDWRTAIYRHMGGKDLTDVVDGANWLASAHGVDAKRMGVYGGSYGGFITFMAMFTDPDVFAAGAALRPVSDWAHYNHWYTSRILNTPTVDPIAFRRSSPIYHADGLKGRLLIAHGMVDSNVQYQDVIRLAQVMIEKGLKNWELASYPVEPHGFQTPSGWYDEYRRIHELFADSLK